MREGFTVPTTNDRWLVYDQRAELADKPGTHALVIGVSVYPYLPPEPGNDNSPPSFGMAQLSSGARSAYVLQNWLLNSAKRMAAPLKTLRVLLAPGPAEADEIRDLSGATCTFDEFVSAVYSWRDDASRHRGDVTLFYFCGNGFDLGPSDAVMALADFGVPRGPVLRGTVSVNHLIQGLAPSDGCPEVARTQLFFIDAGRQRVSFEQYARVTAPPVFDVRPPWSDDRRLAVCHASSPGQRAWAVLGGTSLFLVALMRCLQGAAAVPDQEKSRVSVGSSQNPTAWKVTINSLAATLPAILQEVAREAGAPDQQVFVSSMSGDAVLVRLNRPPLVPVTVVITPEDAARRAKFDIHAADGSPVDIAEGGRTAGQRTLFLPAGFYLVRVSFDPPATGEVNPKNWQDWQFIASLIPPGAAWNFDASTVGSQS